MCLGTIWFTGTTFLTVAIVTGGTATAGVAPCELQKLTVTVPAPPPGNFGVIVAVDGDFALVGVPFDDDMGTDAGAVIALRRINGVWSVVQKFYASNAASSDGFGHAVGLSGDKAIIGAPFKDDEARGAEAGATYLFERIGTVWTEVCPLVGAEVTGGDWFGFAVGISGTRAIVGTYPDHDAPSGRGAAYVFEDCAQVARLTASDGQEGDLFGQAVAIEGDAALVGALLHDGASTDSGAAYVFRFNGSSWVQEQKLLATDGGDPDLAGLGVSVSLSCGVALVGAYGDDDGGVNSGAAYVFGRIGGVWMQMAKLVAPDPVPFAYFGVRVSLSHNNALIGAWGDDDCGAASGSAYLFQDIGIAAGCWELVKLVASDCAGNHRLGDSIAISGTTAFVGSPGAGAAYVFDELMGNLDGDEVVGLGDLAIFLALFGHACR